MRYDGPLLRSQKKNSGLWNNHIPDVTTLRQQNTPHTAYVAIDCEGLHGRKQGQLPGVSEIGVAVLFPSDRERTTSPPVTIAEITEQYRVQSCSFRINGHNSENMWKNKESACFFTTEWVEENQVQESLVALLSAIQERYEAEHGSSLSMVLVGYAMDMEYMILCSSLPEILAGGFFSSWFDLQEMVHDICGTRPSLTDALLALGFPYGPLIYRRRATQHWAGNDVVRELAVLIHILHYAGLPSASAHPFQHPTRPAREKKKMEPFPCSQSRPSPFDKYPFTVSIQLQDGGSIHTMASNAPTLHKIFPQYSFSTTAMTPNGKCGWVCLATEEDRDAFMADVTGNLGHIWKIRALSVAQERDPNTRRNRKKVSDGRLPENENLHENIRQDRRYRKSRVEDLGSLSLGADMRSMEEAPLTRFRE